MSSFKNFPVTEKKNLALQRRMLDLGISENDIKENFIKGGGKGGQKINKTASCVVLSYAKTGDIIKCQQGRSRELNRFFARRLLCDKLDNNPNSNKQSLINKIKLRKKRKAKKTSLKYGIKNVD